MLHQCLILTSSMTPCVEYLTNRIFNHSLKYYNDCVCGKKQYLWICLAHHVQTFSDRRLMSWLVVYWLQMRGSVGPRVSPAQVHLLRERSFPPGPVLLRRLTVPWPGVQRRDARSFPATTSVVDSARRRRGRLRDHTRRRRRVHRASCRGAPANSQQHLRRRRRPWVDCTGIHAPAWFYFSPRESERVCFYRRWFVCLSVTTITKKIVDRFVPNFIGRFPEGKGRPSSCFVTINSGMWK